MSVAPLPDGWSVLENPAAPALPEGWTLAGDAPPSLPEGWSEVAPDAAAPKPDGLLTRFDRFMRTPAAGTPQFTADAPAPAMPQPAAEGGSLAPEEAAAFREQLSPALLTLPRMPDLSGLTLPELPMSSQDFGPQPTPSPAALAGLYNAAAPAAEALTTPTNIAIMASTAGLGALAAGGSTVAKVGLGAVGAGFGGVMAVDTVELVKHAREVLANPDATTQQKIEAVATPAVTGAMSLAALLGVGRMAAGEAIPRINAAYPEVFWKKAGLSAEQFAQDYPATVRRVAGVDGATPTPADIALVQRVNDAAKAAGVKVGDLARGRVVAEQIEWAPRAVQRLLPESLRPAAPAGGGLQFRAVDGTPMAAPAPAAPQAPAPAPGPAGERALLTPAAVDPVQAPKSAIVSAPESPAPTAAAPLEIASNALQLNHDPKIGWSLYGPNGNVVQHLGHVNGGADQAAAIEEANVFLEDNGMSGAIRLVDQVKAQRSANAPFAPAQVAPPESLPAPAVNAPAAGASSLAPIAAIVPALRIGQMETPAGPVTVPPPAPPSAPGFPASVVSTGATSGPAPATVPPAAPEVKPSSRREIAAQRAEIRRLSKLADQAAQTSPERAGKFTAQAQKARERLVEMEANTLTGPTPQVGTDPQGNADLLTHIAEYVGRINMTPQADSTGGEYNGLAEAFSRGAARLLRSSEGGSNIVNAISELNDSAGYKFQSPSEFFAAVDQAVARRQAVGRDVARQAYRDNVEAMAQTDTKKGRRRELVPSAPNTIDEVGVGGEFKLNREKFSVIDTEEGPGGMILYVIQDGHRFTIPEGTPIYPDKGSLKPADVPPAPAAPAGPQSTDPFAENYVEPAAPAAPEPAKGGDLFNAADTFNLAGESVTEAPSAIEAARLKEEANRIKAEQDAKQGDMFGRGPLHEADDGNPFDPADPTDPAMPPIPAGTPAARLNSGRMLSPMERTAPGADTIDIATVHESLLDVIRAAGGESAIREGRFFQKARGIAKQHEETIRVDSLINLPTVVHEIGHVLAKRVFGSMLSRAMIRGIGNGAVVKELQGLGKALYGSRTPTAGYTAEGFSEFIRLWVSTEDAARLAPTATTWFEQTWMRDNPEIAFALRSARDAMDLWRGQGAEGRVRAQQKADPTRWQRVRDAVRKSLSRRQLVEESAPLEALAATVERKIKGKLLPGSNPALVFQSVRQTAGAMLETMVERGVVDANGRVIAPPLREAYAALRPADAENFRDYLVMLQVIERFKQGHKSTGFNVEDAVYLRDKLGADPRFVTAAEKVAKWNSDVLKYWRDAFPEQNTALYNAIVKRNPKYYTPLARVLDPAKVKPGTATQGSSNLSRFKGSSLPVKQAIEQTLKGAESLIARAHRDMVMRVVVAIAKMPGMGFVLEPVPRQRVVETLNVEKIRSQLEAMGVDTTAIPPDEMLSYAAQLDAPTGTDPIISLNINGQTQWFQTLPDVYEVLAGVQEPARLGLAFEALAGGPSRIFRLGATGLRAGFSLFTNPARDFQTFQLQSIYGNPATRTAAYFAALRDIVWAGLSGKESPALQLVSQLGLQSSTFIGGDIAQIQRTAKGLFRHNKLTRTVLTPIESMRELLSFTETAPRLAEFMLALDESGWKPGQPLSVNQVVALRLAFKRVTTDFSAKGAGWDVVRRAVPFSNANVQGTRAMLRATRTDQGPRDQAKAWAKFVLNGVALLTVPSIMEYLANKDEDWYNALPWKERFLYFNIKMGNQVVQIPKPMEWGLAFTVLPTALLDSLNKQDPRAFKEALGHSFDVANPLTLPVLPKAYIEQKQNRIDFFNRPIVPRAELDLRPGSQVGRYTSALGKALGEAFPETVSPRRFDAAVRGVLGGLGGDLLDGPEAVMRSLGLATSNDREWEPADMFVVGKAFRRGGPVTANNRHLFEFWDDLNRYRAMSASYSHALKQRAEEEARTGTASTPIPKDITARDRLYAALLEGRYVEIKARIDVAERSKETVVRQKLYARAGELARSALTLRPKD